MEVHHMANRKFTKEEMEQLRASPYVLDVGPSVVYFSVEFKQRFWGMLQENKPTREIIIELGIDPDILGKTRIDGLKGMIRKDGRAGKGFRDLNTYEYYLKEYTGPEYRIKRLEQELAYKDQEIEFLKKIVSLGLEDMEQ
jgi:transposase-like protein